MSRQGKREPRVVFGFHAVLARLRADPKSVLEIFLDETRNDARAKDLAAHRDSDKKITALARQAAHALAFGAEHPGN